MCIGQIELGTLEHCELSAVIFEGLTITTPDGRTARLAIVDEHNNIIESGEQVAREAWNVSIASYKNFLKGEGHLKVHTTPPGIRPSRPRKVA
ncbi:hypothetical protein [Chromobacterium haemolyticum]|uniref:Uncharacterized protein n=1 Tax=Chromobacterium haemolyticum TaxID=394935 RepID=A0A1W0CM65_9NEIS|nr:hypothetical protein [Chromobacterium haemolyticum]OQS35907.1 hypothetical protein B0T45_17025 [Chromobacterium haemolyticum]